MKNTPDFLFLKKFVDHTHSVWCSGQQVNVVFLSYDNVNTHWIIEREEMPIGRGILEAAYDKYYKECKLSMDKPIKTILTLEEFKLYATCEDDFNNHTKPKYLVFIDTQDELDVPTTLGEWKIDRIGEYDPERGKEYAMNFISIHR